MPSQPVQLYQGRAEQSNRGKPGGSAALESFSNAPFVVPGMFKIVEGLLSSSTSGEQCGTSASSPAPSASTLCGSLQSTIAALRRDADECRGKISNLQSQITVLTEERRASCKVHRGWDSSCSGTWRNERTGRCTTVTRPLHWSVVKNWKSQATQIFLSCKKTCMKRRCLLSFSRFGTLSREDGKKIVQQLTTLWPFWSVSIYAARSGSSRHKENGKSLKNNIRLPGEWD